MKCPESEILRPDWCQDRSCVPTTHTPGAVGGEHGESSFCVGQTPEPMVTERGGVRHVNDGHFCFRSPVRGVVMLETNSTDLDLIARLALRDLVKRDPGVRFNWRWYTGRKTDAD